MADTSSEEKVNWLTIDGVKMPTPSAYKYVEADFDSENSVRSETGILTRDVIRTNVHSPEFTWNTLTTAQLKTLLQAVNQATKHDITVFDPNKDDFQTTFTGYVQATRKIDVVVPRDDPIDTVWKLTLSFIEY